MLKSNKFKKNESSIRLRVQVRRLTAIVKGIEELLHLWKRTDKFNEYWDNIWSQQAGDVEFHVAHIDGKLRVINHFCCICQGYNDVSHYDKHDYIDSIRTNGPRQISPCDMNGVKLRLSGLESRARATGKKLHETVEQNWTLWKRPEPYWEFEAINVKINILLEMESDIKQNWESIQDFIEEFEYEYEKWKSFGNKWFTPDVE